MVQDSPRYASKRPQDRSKTVSSALRALQGPPQEAKILPKPKENQCFLPSRFFASDGLLRPQDGPKMAQDRLRWIKIASDTHLRGLQTASRGFQVPSEPSEDPPKRPKSFKNQKKINVCWFLAFSLPMAFRGVKMAPKPKENTCLLPSRLFASDELLRPQDGPKMTQESPKRCPRGPQEGPKSAQERSKTASRGAQEAI